jgi:threonine/homoserine/homoserine lactone efflux protein
MAIALSPLLKGAIYGFLIAAGVGPIWLLCLRRALTQGFWAGFASGLGAATADAAYGVVAAFGLAAVTGFLVSLQTPLQLFGGIFLVFLGLRSARAKPTPRAAEPPSTENGLRLYTSTLALTLANPLTILSFIAAFAGLGGSGGGVAPALLVTGVFAGSACWWLVLCGLAGRYGKTLGENTLRIVNLVSGLTIAAFGSWQLATLLQRASR